MSNQQIANQPAKDLHFPGGPLPLNSHFYIERPPIEQNSYRLLCQPGSVIRIKAPRKMGKSSLMLRIIDQATELGYHKATVDFQQAEEEVFASLDKFLRWFCANVARQLHLKPMLDEYWDEDIGSKVSCTLYFQGYLLEGINAPLLLALNEVNQVFEHTKIAKDFLPLLRSWHESAKQAESFEKLRLVVVHSTEVYVPLNLNQSPFNVGSPIKLPELTLEQIIDLAQRYGLGWRDNKNATELMNLVGGHPYLIQCALYHLACQGVSLEELLEQAPTASGIYRNHLQELLATLREDPELDAALQQAIATEGSVKLEAIAAYKLESMGLVKLEGDRCQVSCQLYRRYFSQPNRSLSNYYSERLQELEQVNQQLTQLVNIDGVTQLPNRRFFDTKLQEEWENLAAENSPLSLILCDIDFFKIYNDSFGHPAGDKCLRTVADTIQKLLKEPKEIAARYGGEELAVILPGKEAFSAFYLAERIREEIKGLGITHDEYRMGGVSPILTVSLGVACTIPTSEEPPEILVSAADEALYQSKRKGRDRVTVSEKLDYGLLE